MMTTLLFHRRNDCGVRALRRSFMIALVTVSCVLQAQSSLTIVDAVSPYKLNPTVLNNGHFSIATNYTTPTKGIIYREDGTNNKPVNYTSFFHVKIDNDVYQQSYESDTSGFGVAVQHPIITKSIFRDTVSGAPRVNARSIAVLPNGDTMRFVFSMLPVKRPSGGFIRLSVQVENSSTQSHRVGVLFLIDTKIGDNDQAPIATAYGYSTVEKQFDRGVGSGLPDFWLALEGTPVAPGLVARGNLRDAGLVEPDRLLFGNWTDFTSQGIRGLGSAMWKERNASANQYTDSAVLLLWDEEVFGVGTTRVKASTEIGIVDSLSVGFGGGGGGGGGGGFGGGGFGLAGAGTCLTVDTVRESPCGVPDYSPYLPDTLQALYLVSNLDSQKTSSNVNIRIEQLPLGLYAPQASTQVIPSVLGAEQTGVCAVSIVPMPRLSSTSYRVPIAVTADPNATVVVRDTLDICIPGLAAKLIGVDSTYPPVCPQSVDTFDVKFRLKGVRCLALQGATLSGAAADLALFSIIQPLPQFAKADSIVSIRVRYAPTANNYTPTVGVVLTLRDFETLAPNDTTFDFPSDTSFISCPSREAEFEFGRVRDTLDFGHICIGDTAKADWDILNIGGCTVTINSCLYTAVLNSSAFSSDPSTTLPAQIQRSGLKTLNFLFTPTQAGKYLSLAIVSGPNAPQRDTLVLIGEADQPALQAIASSIALDTVCAGTNGQTRIELKNTTACAVVVDSIRISGSTAGWTASPAKTFTIPPRSSIMASVTASFPTVGNYTGTVTVYSGSQQMSSTLSIVVVTRSFQSNDTLDFGNVFVKQNGRDSIVLHSNGTAELVVNALTLAGLYPSEYSLNSSVPLPATVPPGDSLIVYIRFNPADIEQRSATLVVRTNSGLACAAQKSLVLHGRGVQPLVDVRSRTLALGRLCIGTTIDTVIVVRNPGNYPLRINNISSVGAPSFSIASVNGAVVDPDSSFRIAVRYTPDQIGAVSASISLSTNGTWITPNDTLISLNAGGIVCGTIAADTVDAPLGQDLLVPLRFIPDSNSTKTASELVALMNSSTNQRSQIRVGYDNTLVRLHRIENNSDVLAQRASLTEGAASSTLHCDNQALQQSSVLATLRGDVLLSQTYQSTVLVEVDTFANGFSRIRTQNGLVRSQYCAFNNRQVNTALVQLLLNVQHSEQGVRAQVYSKETCEAHFEVYNAQGQRVHNEALSLHSGIQDIHIPEQLESGFYIVVVTTPSDQRSDRMLLCR